MLTKKYMPGRNYVSSTAAGVANYFMIDTPRDNREMQRPRENGENDVW